MSDADPTGLRARREALGWTLDDVAQATRIPVEHVRAVEEGRLHDLPSGPWADGYQRAIRDHLGVDDDEGGPEEPEPPLGGEPPPPALPLWMVRAVAGGSVLLLLAVIGWQARILVYGPPPDLDDQDAPAALPDQVVRVVTRRNTRLRVAVDDEVVLDRAVAGGEDLTFSAHDRVVVEIAAASAARFEYNGRTVVPQGRQDAPRKLVFIDDVQARARAPREAPPGQVP